jgi:FAD/FMN-containing dehydrogenase
MSVHIDTTALGGLRANFLGELLSPDDSGYEVARRIWNGRIDRRPALIARCMGVADVMAAVRFARDGELPAAVRGGGHAVPGHALCDDGLVIDLSPMRGHASTWPAPPSGSRAAASTSTSTARAKRSGWRRLRAFIASPASEG